MQTTLSSGAIAAPANSFLNFVKSAFFKLLVVSLIASVLYFFARPAELSNQAWLVFTTFAATIVTIILKPLPMGALALIAVAFLAFTKAISLPIILQGFSHDLIWLIIMSCFLARGFIKTGLGKRIAYYFLSVFGGTPLGLSYGFLLSASTMAPLIPSATARTGGILLPVLKSIIKVIEEEKATNRIAEFLTLIVINSSVITSAMFMTSNGGNPIAVKFAKNFGISIDWNTWAIAAALPAFLSLLLLPFILKLFVPCRIENPSIVKLHAKEELRVMGPVSFYEKITLSVFALLLVLWSCGSFFNVHPTEAAFLGVGLFLLAGVLTWHDILNEELAWDTFVWMAILIMMATELQNFGVISFFTKKIMLYIPCYNWQVAFVTLSVIYYYTHYFFASTTAHLSSMFTPFVGVLVALGAPPLVTALSFGFMTNLFGALTQYASGPAPILYSLGHVEFKNWLKAGFITSVFYLAIWIGVGFFWWKFLGLF
jgi:divalent anion:Na+ symporter, DASS family